MNWGRFCPWRSSLTLIEVHWSEHALWMKHKRKLSWAWSTVFQTHMSNLRVMTCKASRSVSPTAGKAIKRFACRFYCILERYSDGNAWLFSVQYIRYACTLNRQRRRRHGFRPEAATASRMSKAFAGHQASSQARHNLPDMWIKVSTPKVNGKVLRR